MIDLSTVYQRINKETFSGNYQSTEGRNFTSYAINELYQIEQMGICHILIGRKWTHFYGENTDLKEVLSIETQTKEAFPNSNCSHFICLSQEIPQKQHRD